MKTQEEVVRQHAVGPINIYKIYQEGYQDRELDDWNTFRREAAKDFMSSVIIREAPQYNFACRNVKSVVSEAIMWADELIKQLKEK